jgi:hypothetical protein
MPLMGGDNWTSGALPSIYQGRWSGPRTPACLNLDPPSHLAGAAQRNQLEMIERLNARHAERFRVRMTCRRAWPGMGWPPRCNFRPPRPFDLSNAETQETIRLYGIDPTDADYGTRCLIARFSSGEDRIRTCGAV